MGRRSRAFICLFVVFVLIIAATAVFAACDKPCKHENSEVVSDTATCLAGGIRTLKCKDCDEEWTEDSPALGHDYQLMSENAASCLENGSRTYKCKRCDDVYNEVSGSACGHDIVDEVTPSTCTKEGLIVHKCRNCDFEESEVIPMADHDFKEEIKEPTCKDEGYTLRTCKICEYKETVDYKPATGEHDYHATCTENGVCSGCGAVQPATNHKYEFINDTATCTEDGVATYKCVYCEYNLTEKSVKKGHNVSEWYYTDEKDEDSVPECAWNHVKSGYCLTCEQTVTEKTPFSKHVYVASITQTATCKTPGIKTFTCACGESYTEDYIDADNHNWTEGETADGYTNYTCSDCGATKKTKSAKEEVSVNVSKDDIVNTDEIELKNASVSMDKATKEALTSDNMTLSADILTQEQMNDLKLSEEDKTKIGDSSVYNFTLSDGENLITEFGGKVQVKVPYTLQEGEDPDNIVIWYINELGEVEAIKDVTYSNGYAVFSTTHFSYYTVVRLTPAERCELYGHSYQETEVKATCYNEGYIYRICIRCGHSERQVTADALTHEYEMTVQDPTCTQIGWKTYTCKNCNNVYKEIIPAKEHVYVAKVLQEASCTQAGEVEYTCSECDASYTTRTDKLPHDCSQEVVKPTCTKDGYTLNTCKTCGFSYKTNIAKAWGHDVQDKVIEPTCTAQGYTIHTCTRCDYKITDNYVAAKGHTWDIAAPTCGRGQVCVVCSEKGLPATGKHTMNSDGVCEICGQGCAHNFSEQVIAPGCESAGYTLKTCSICGKVEKGNYVSATGHNWVADDSKTPTCTQSGYIHSVCANCAQEKNDYLLPKGHNYSDGRCVNCGRYQNSEGLLYTNMFNSIFANTYVFYTSDFTLPDNLLAEHAVFDDAKFEIRINEDGRLEVKGEVTYTIINSEKSSGIVKFVSGEQYTYVLVKSYDEVGNYTEQNYLQYVKISTDDFISINFGLSVEKLKQIIGFINTDLKNICTKLQQENPEMFENFMASLANGLFVQESSGDGYRFNLSRDGVSKFYNNLMHAPVSSFIDSCFGEGTYDKIKTFILDSQDKKISEVIDKVVNAVEGYGLDINDLYALIDRFVYIVSGSEFSIKDQITEIGDMIFGEFVTQSLEVNGIGEIFETFENIALLEIYLGEMPAEINDIINEIIASVPEKANLEIIADSDGNIASFKLIFNSLTADDVNLLDGTFVIEPDGSVEFSEELAGITSYIEARISEICLPDGETSAKIDDVYTLVKENGKCYIEAEFNDVETGWYENEIGMIYATGYFRMAASDFVEYLITKDCNDIYQYSMRVLVPVEGFSFKYRNSSSGELEPFIPTEDNFNVEIDFYLNVKTKEFLDKSSHKYVKDEEKSYDNNLCISEGVDYYVCEYCQAVKLMVKRDSHTFQTIAQLLPGAKTCEDGAKIISECKVCGLKDEHVTYGHEKIQETLDFTKYGCDNDQIKIEKCACGEVSRLSNESEMYLIMSWRQIGNQTAGDKIITYFRCPDNDFVLGISKYNDNGETSCINKEVTEFYLNANPDDADDYSEKIVLEQAQANHSYEVVSWNLNDEVKGCEGGGVIYYECTGCHDTYQEEIRGHQIFSTRQDLSAYGCQCGGYAVIERCACGYTDYVAFVDTGCVFDENTQATENPGETVTIYTCSKCGFTYKMTVMRNVEGCRVTERTEYDVAGNIYAGADNVYYQHEMFKEVQLFGSKCTEGAHVVERCRVCGEMSTEYDTYSHDKTTNEEILDLSHDDCTCNEKLTINRCACGEYQEVNLNSKCDFDCTTDYFTEEGYEECRRDTYICAVTSPKCAFKYIVEEKTKKNGCTKITTRTYIYGVSDADPDGVYSYTTQDAFTQHRFEYVAVSNNDAQDEQGNRVNTLVEDYKCLDCGYVQGTRTTETTYDSNNVDIAVRITEGDSVTSKERKVKGDIYSELLTVYMKSSWMGEIYCTYDEETCMVKTEKRTSDGIVLESQEEEYHINPDKELHPDLYVTIPRTCTQEGKKVCHCMFCDKENVVETIYPNGGHSYVYDSQKQMHICSFCGLENFTGADGNIILEDMSDDINYIVGYYRHDDGYKYVVNVSLVIKDNPVSDPILLEDVTVNDDGKSIITVSRENVAQAAAAKGYDMANYDVRIAFVPVGAGELDYGLTITDGGSVATQK